MADFKINGTTFVSETSGTLSIDASQIKVNGTAVIGAASGLMFRNKIINGDMRIDQRNAGNQSASNSAGSLYYGPDRFQLESDQAGKFNVQQNKGSQTPPSTFTKYYGVESLSAYSTGASNYTLVSHHIEGQNISDLKFGTAEAKTITLSFWVRSNVSGTNNVYVGSLRNATYDRSFVFTYTINLSNAWEYKTITIPGDTSGTWATDNTAGIRIGWDLGSGSNYQTSTTNTWLATNAFTASSTKMCATSGATLFLTGVQLEIGTVATPFEHRPIGMELSLCQRYYQFLGTLHASNPDYPLGRFSGNSNMGIYGVTFLTEMRATPSVTMNVEAVSGGTTGNQTATSVTPTAAFDDMADSSDILDLRYVKADAEL